MKRILGFLLVFIWMIGLMDSSVFGAVTDRVVADVEVLSENSARISLKWAGDSTTPIRMTTWRFDASGNLTVQYVTGSDQPTGFSSRTVESTTHTFPCRLFLQEDGITWPLSDVTSYGGDDGAIYNLYTRGIIGGYPDGSFQKDNPVTRAEFSKMLLLTADYALSGQVTIDFEDVRSHWGKSYIYTLAGKGILKGKGENLFDPNGSITIGEVLTVLTRSFSLYESGKTYPYALTSHWSNDYFLSAVDQGLIVASDSFYSNYDGNEKATRAQCARLLSRVLESFHSTAQ